MRDGGGGVVGMEALDATHAHARASHTPSVSSIASGGRIRFVRLLRRPGESYGFSLRGGREHGTGFFISHVEPGSEAFNQGLRAGDQVQRVDNLSVEGAVHHEVTAMVQGKTSVILKVKSAGIIPVKEHRGDPLTWLVVDEDDEGLSDHGTDTTYTHHDLEPFHQPPPTPQGHDAIARVYISCPGKVGLGCSICKGPAEKPGIFVQSVRGGGVAKNAGLRPGDQIIACNEVSFAHLEFAEAVYVLKSSPRLVVDVVRGAGLELVAGESSGYNSSASSVAGDQTPPSSASSSEQRDPDQVTSRLSAVSRHLTLDRSRGWREIESEWAEAEMQEKRRQLHTSQRTLKTRAQRDARFSSHVSSRSLGNLSAALREEEDEEQRTAFRDGPSSPVLHHPTHHKVALRSTRSSSDVTDDHKIALVTSADPHVNNIVVSGGPKDERDAVSRLDQLSSPSAGSRTSTLSSGSSQVTVRSSCGSGGTPSEDKAESVVEQQLRELREEQRRLQEEAHRLAQERRKFEEEKRRGLERTQSAPLAPLVINCSGQALPPHLTSPPSPTASIASGRHTTRVLIKSPPPPPPPRKNTTSLSSRSSYHPQQISPPASPTHSNSSSSGVGSSCGSSAPPRRCKSIGSLSASSGESAVWEDSPIPSHPPLGGRIPYRSAMPPPPPPKPPAQPSATLSSTSSTYPSGVPPPPPPPPPQPTSKPQTNLTAALSKELERRSQQDAQSGEAKARFIEDRIDNFKKEKIKSGGSNSSSAQHEKLMAEFKLAHKKMFKENQDNAADNCEQKEKQIEIKLKKVQVNPTPQKEFTSKIINSSSITKTPLRATNNVTAASMDSPAQKKTLPNFTVGIAGSVRNNSSVSNNVGSKTSLPASNTEKKQVNEQLGGPTLASIKAQLCPQTGGSAELEEFTPEENSSVTIQPPPAYFDSKKATPTKPLVTIGSYPSPNHRPTPVKMDFLPSSSVNDDLHGTVKSHATASKMKLQNELESTLSRSNLRQRFVAKELPPDPPSESGGNKEETGSGFTTTTITNNNIPPNASLSTKYKNLGKDMPSVTITMQGGSGKENEVPDSPPSSGILKPSGPPSIRPLQKSISFGDVTTVGEEDPSKNSSFL